MRLGVIDIGSNTVHMLVVDAHWGARPLPAVSHKMELRLSEHTDEQGHIDKQGVRSLEKFAGECLRIVEDQGVARVMGFVTSAIREAGNGDGVLAMVRESTGADLQILSGADEARLTFLAVRRWFGWSSGRLLVVDIGGGSLEIAAGLDEDPDVAVSFELGAGRVTRTMLQGDPPSPELVREVRRRIRTTIARDMRELTKAGAPDLAVGTSKTMRTLARVLGAAPSSEGAQVKRHLEREALADLVPRLAGMTAGQRAALPGVSASRAHQLLAGALVAEAAMDLLQLERLEICPWALREGVILNELDLMRME
ncbi:Ppx/GppA phosphatase family protein [Arsenicicoccus sp. oral taxon 190]|uniref:Ppx/GppA phosphatase family protein n=1 Tax=Arsenicicoccus sp. oral taxon 190 TaxID=1658671 RepID=UPI00067A2916|nr:Ppx/GppA phosphatase family protein [Arsenicicoccus sp. oral taxon 190]AKT51181.1 exopolyphosphatase [Arsenicicoccus sp. oral taxon 190]